MCVEWSIVLPFHFVYSDLWETCLLFPIYITLASHRCQSSVLTWLTGTMGVFCFCRVSLMCKNSNKINPPRRRISDLCHSRCHRQVHTAITERLWPTDSNALRQGSSPAAPLSLPPSVKQWSHSPYQESADCLKCLPLRLTERYFFFPSTLRMARERSGE